MSLAAKLRAAAADPVSAFYVAWSRLDPGSLLEVYRRRARNAGLDRLYFLLSLDCDTADDIAVAWDVHSRLTDFGVLPAYAVPGELLAEGADVYRRIAATGAEFMNHGDRRHTYYDAEAGAYRACFFYDQQPRDVVAADIEGGDRAVADVLGRRPRGFRTPHFGTFQGGGQLRFLHGILKDLGYEFSTSTTPRYGLRYGPAFDRMGVREIPLSGPVTRPWAIFDTCGYFLKDRDMSLGPEDYRREAVGMAERLAPGPGLINYYADPSHIADEPLFFETVARLCEIAEPVTYQTLLERLK